MKDVAPREVVEEGRQKKYLGRVRRQENLRDRKSVLPSEGGHSRVSGIRHEPKPSSSRK